VDLRIQTQINPVADEVSAVTAVVRPILLGVLYALKAGVAAELGGHGNIKLFMLPRLYRPGDGDCGICFEYAVHDAVLRGEPGVLDRVTSALSVHCNVPGHDPTSILFGAEKTGAQQIIDTAAGLLTPDSLLMYGTRGRPVKLKTHLNLVAAAFRRPTARTDLPLSIRDLWKADLFLGYGDTDKWVGTSVKINPNQLEAARGLRVGIVPALEGDPDLPALHEAKNLVVCPLPYDGSFMEVFYRGWGVVQQFMKADAQLPGEVFLPRPADRQVARYLADRREFSVMDVLAALEPLAQPHLLNSDEKAAQLSPAGAQAGPLEATALVAPVPKTI